VYLESGEVVAANAVLPLPAACRVGGVNSSLPNPLAGSEGPLRGGIKSGKGRKGKGKERWKGWEKNTPEINFWLGPWEMVARSARSD